MGCFVWLTNWLACGGVGSQQTSKFPCLATSDSLEHFFLIYIYFFRFPFILQLFFVVYVKLFLAKEEEKKTKPFFVENDLHSQTEPSTKHTHTHIQTLSPQIISAEVQNHETLRMTSVVLNFISWFWFQKIVFLLLLFHKNFLEFFGNNNENKHNSYNSLSLS